jgi:hypothetical protein
MAHRPGLALLLAALSLMCVRLAEDTAMAAVLDKHGESLAKEATHLFNQGHYEEAAIIYSTLAVEYPSMVIFYRNLGACFYYLRSPEPALSNLRQYLLRRRNIAPEDRAIVDGWIAEMVRLRAQKPDEGDGPLPPPTPSGPPEHPDSSAPSGVASAPEPAVTRAPAFGVGTARRDVVSVPPPPTHDQPVAEGRPFYKAWWFWTGAAAAVIGGTATAFLIPRSSSMAPCENPSYCLGVK